MDSLPNIISTNAIKKRIALDARLTETQLKKIEEAINQISNNEREPIITIPFITETSRKYLTDCGFKKTLEKDTYVYGGVENEATSLTLETRTTPSTNTRYYSFVDIMAGLIVFYLLLKILV